MSVREEMFMVGPEKNYNVLIEDDKVVYAPEERTDKSLKEILLEKKAEKELKAK